MDSAGLPGKDKLNRFGRCRMGGLPSLLVLLRHWFGGPEVCKEVLETAVAQSSAGVA